MTDSPSGKTVFLSYANGDRDRVETLVTALEREGMNVWWDQEIPRGQNFNRVIENALGQAQCAIVVWSAASVKSEWVFNEASEARKRQILVPALIDAVEPPLEFRHLQAARLIGWTGDQADVEWKGLLDAVRGLLGQTNGPITPAAIRTPPHQMPAQLPRSPQTWWRTPAGAAAGAGALLVGVALLLMALNQIGLTGGATPEASATTSGEPGTAVASSGAGAGTSSESRGATTSSTAEPRPAGTSPLGTAVADSDRINLLDPAEGGMLVIANEDGWRSIIATTPTTTTLASGGFAVFAFRGEKPVRIDAVGAYVDYSNGRNIKDLLISASDQSETGPFRKIAVITVPNYRNMRGPVHEFAVTPFTAKYVKVEIQHWQNDGDFPNGYVGTLRLFGTHQ